MQFVAVCCSVLQCTAVRCSVLQCVAACCSVLQCAAVCCSLYQTTMELSCANIYLCLLEFVRGLQLKLRQLTQAEACTLVVFLRLRECAVHVLEFALAVKRLRFHCSRADILKSQLATTHCKTLLHAAPHCRSYCNTLCASACCAQTFSKVIFIVVV